MRVLENIVFVIEVIEAAEAIEAVEALEASLMSRYKYACYIKCSYLTSWIKLICAKIPNLSHNLLYKVNFDAWIQALGTDLDPDEKVTIFQIPIWTHIIIETDFEWLEHP